MTHAQTILGTLGSPPGLRSLAKMASGLKLLQLAPPPFLVCAPLPENLLKMGFPGCDVRGKVAAAPAYASSSLISRAEPSLAQPGEKGVR